MSNQQLGTHAVGHFSFTIGMLCKQTHLVSHAWQVCDVLGIKMYRTRIFPMLGLMIDRQTGRLINRKIECVILLCFLITTKLSDVFFFPTYFTFDSSKTISLHLVIRLRLRSITKTEDQSRKNAGLSTLLDNPRDSRFWTLPPSHQIRV